MIRETEYHKHLFFQVTGENPPTVIVDNNRGYITYLPETGGYKNAGLKYSSIKQVQGLNVYASTESIGICIFKNDTMFSVTDMQMSDFFETSLPDEVSTSVYAALPVSNTHFITVGIVNVSPEVNRVVYASKSIETNGARLAITTKLNTYGANEVEQGIHSSLYNEDGSYTGETPDVNYVTYEGYNGSTGFGSIATETIEFGEDIDSSMFTLTELTIRDMGAIVPELDTLRNKQMYSICSQKHEDYMFFVGVSLTHIYVYSKKLEEQGILTTYEFKVPTIQAKFNNPSEQYAKMIPRYSNGKVTDYDSIYTPQALYREFKKIKACSITRIEEKEVEIDGETETKTFISEYLLTPHVDTALETVSFIPKLDEDEDKAIPTSSVASLGDKDNSRNTFGLSLQTINIGAVTDTDVIARNRDMKHFYGDEVGLAGQESPISSVKSLCDFIAYS